jgi:hypothetical protein
MTLLAACLLGEGLQAFVLDRRCRERYFVVPYSCRR